MLVLDIIPIIGSEGILKVIVQALLFIVNLFISCHVPFSRIYGLTFLSLHENFSVILTKCVELLLVEMFNTERSILFLGSAGILKLFSVSIFTSWSWDIIFNRFGLFKTTKLVVV